MFSYVNHLLRPLRRKTRVVQVGDIKIGGQNQIVVQSMTTTPSTDVKATVDQIERLKEVGCEIARVTTPTMSDAQALKDIKKEMQRRKIHMPLVADVHFLPKIALYACDWVDKVRINPGNFADRKRFEIKEYSDQEYANELDRVRDEFLPIVKRAKQNGIAIRIGTNHGSLSDRIMNRFGDTPKGMVESAIEFINVAKAEGFHDLIVSMKASNVQVMIQAYRLLVSRMYELSMDYPLHLGVTEAGDGEDGRIKSAVGIGSLLSDGLGDTIRVSLTEDPEHEIPVARQLVQLYARPFQDDRPIQNIVPCWSFYEHRRRDSKKINNGLVSYGKGETVAVSLHSNVHHHAQTFLNQKTFEPKPDRVVLELTKPSIENENAFLKNHDFSLALKLQGASMGDFNVSNMKFDELSVAVSSAWQDKEYRTKLLKLLNGRILWFRVSKFEELPSLMDVLKSFDSSVPLGVEIQNSRLIDLTRKTVTLLNENKLNVPILLDFVASPNMTDEEVRLRAAVELGSLLCDGLGDLVQVQYGQNQEFSNQLAFNVLQACRLRMTKTDFIACPSCGRTLFDLQSTTQKIREKTGHLKGLKIAIMGCIVNGPGEMADADFGYVGSGPSRINLYVGQDCVQRNIDQEQAVDALVSLIKSHNRWIEPNSI